MTKLFLDTNILARFLLGDIIEQSQTVLDIFKKAKNSEYKLFIIPEVLIELNYVLKSIYKLQKEDITFEFRKILNFSFIDCLSEETISNALDLFQNNNISFEDAYFISHCLLNELEFFSFDEKANKVYKKLLSK